MIIRSVESKDLTEVVRLNNIEAKWVGAHDESFFEKYIDVPFFNVVDDNGKVKAFMMAMGPKTDYDSKNFLWFKDRIKSFYYVDRIIVDPLVRSRGLGKALYGKLFEFRKGLPIVAEVSIAPPNAESVKFHERFGFREMGEFSADGKKTCRMYYLD